MKVFINDNEYRVLEGDDFRVYIPGGWDLIHCRGKTILKIKSEDD